MFCLFIGAVTSTSILPSLRACVAAFNDFIAYSPVFWLGSPKSIFTGSRHTLTTFTLPWTNASGEFILKNLQDKQLFIAPDIGEYILKNAPRDFKGRNR